MTIEEIKGMFDILYAELPKVLNDILLDNGGKIKVTGEQTKKFKQHTNREIDEIGIDDNILGGIYIHENGVNVSYHLLPIEAQYNIAAALKSCGK